LCIVPPPLTAWGLHVDDCLVFSFHSGVCVSGVASYVDGCARVV